MTAEPEPGSDWLRTGLRRLAAEHEPDRHQIRRRFEELRGVAPGSGAGSSGRAPATGGGNRAPSRVVGLGLRAAAVMAVLGLGVAGLQAVGRSGGPLDGSADGVELQAGDRADGGDGAGPTSAPPAVPAGDPGPAPGPPVLSAPADPAVGSDGPDAAPAAPAPAGSGPVATAAPGAPAPTATGPASAAPAGDRCAHNDGVTVGRFRVLNDLWGTVDHPVAGWQCVATAPAPGADAVAWSTSWQWPTDQGQVKSFSAAFLGWHWGWPVERSGLPVAMADRPGLRGRWDFTVAEQAPGRMDVAWDLWFHDQPHPGGEDLPVSEVRILLHQSRRERPATGRVDTVTIGDATWDVYLMGTRWDVLTFYRSEPTPTGSAISSDLDLGAFLEVAARTASLPWLTSIHAGTDVIDGAGRLDTARLSVTIS